MTSKAKSEAIDRRERVTIIRGGRGDTPQAATENAYLNAVGAAVDVPDLQGNPAFRGKVDAIAAFHMRENPMSPLMGKTWFEAVVAVSFPVATPSKEDAR